MDQYLVWFCPMSALAHHGSIECIRLQQMQHQILVIFPSRVDWNQHAMPDCLEAPHGSIDFMWRGATGYFPRPQLPPTAGTGSASTWECTICQNLRRPQGDGHMRVMPQAWHYTRNLEFIRNVLASKIGSASMSAPDGNNREPRSAFCHKRCGRLPWRTRYPHTCP